MVIWRRGKKKKKNGMKANKVTARQLCFNRIYTDSMRSKYRKLNLRMDLGASASSTPVAGFLGVSLNRDISPETETSSIITKET